MLDFNFVAAIRRWDKFGEVLRVFAYAALPVKAVTYTKCYNIISVYMYL